VVLQKWYTLFSFFQGPTSSTHHFSLTVRLQPPSWTSLLNFPALLFTTPHTAASVLSRTEIQFVAPACSHLYLSTPCKQDQHTEGSMVYAACSKPHSVFFPTTVLHSQRALSSPAHSAFMPNLVLLPVEPLLNLFFPENYSSTSLPYLVQTSLYVWITSEFLEAERIAPSFGDWSNFSCTTMIFRKLNQLIPSVCFFLTE
jgi:hypothetical protein